MGACSGRCLGSIAAGGLLEDPATAALPGFITSAADADWLTVRMLLPRRTGDRKLPTPPLRCGDGEWTDDAWLVTSLSRRSSVFLSAATSGPWSLAGRVRGQRSWIRRNYNPACVDNSNN